MADDLDFFYSGGLNTPPPKKEKIRGKAERFFKKYLKNRLPDKRKIKSLIAILSKKERRAVIGLALVIIGSVIALPIGYYFKITEAGPDFGGSFTEGLVGEPRFINTLFLKSYKIGGNYLLINAHK